jgi:hypothetical protein
MMNTTHSKQAAKGIRLADLLRTNVRLLLSTRENGRPSAGAGAKWVGTIYYEETNQSLADAQNAACRLVGVCDKRGNEIREPYPEALRMPLLAAADQPANEKMARVFFQTLRQRGQIALVQVHRGAPKPERPPATPESRQSEPEEDDECCTCCGETREACAAASRRDVDDWYADD